MASINIEIKNFLAEKIRVSANDLEDSTEVYSSGTFSSLVVLELLSHLEHYFNIEIEASELNQENFINIRSITSLVERKVIAKTAEIST